jgi:hypothetical protein
MASARGDELITGLIAGGPDTLTNELLAEVFHGYPVTELRRLLYSDTEAAVRAGAWIVSELAADAAPLIDDIAVLLGHRLRYVRFYAVDAALTAARPADGPVIARVIGMINDPDDAVRWKVLDFLTRASDEQLAAAVPLLTDATLRMHAGWLLRAATDPAAAADVLARLDHPDRLARVFAVAAAARQAELDRSLLERAVGSADEEVSSFAREHLEWPHRR